MTAIGKLFVHDSEHFVVMIKGHDHFICISLRDKQAWRFSFAELRQILKGKK